MALLLQLFLSYSLTAGYIRIYVYVPRTMPTSTLLFFAAFSMFGHRNVALDLLTRHHFVLWRSFLIGSHACAVFETIAVMVFKILTFYLKIYVVYFLCSLKGMPFLPAAILINGKLNEPLSDEKNAKILFAYAHLREFVLTVVRLRLEREHYGNEHQDSPLLVLLLWVLWLTSTYGIMSTGFSSKYWLVFITSRQYSIRGSADRK